MCVVYIYIYVICPWDMEGGRKNIWARILDILVVGVWVVIGLGVWEHIL